MGKRILITGGSGLLGQYLNTRAAEKNEILTVYNNNPGNCQRYNYSRADLMKRELVGNIFSSFKPEIVIHTAAYTNSLILPGQKLKDIYELNVNATKHLAELCNQHNSKLIFISTDLIYAGYRGSMLKEDAKVIPASLYAETKLMGEIKIKQTFDNYLILRTALLYGFGLDHSQCHFQNINDSLINGNPVKLFVDQFRTPISLIDAADIITKIVGLELKGKTINLGGNERLSRYELGEVLCSIAGFDKSLLEKITLDDIPQLPKVEDVSLNTDKLQSLGLKARSIDENILEMMSGH
jgi:dTDP-4-dehydrorhamnose reductase